MLKREDWLLDPHHAPGFLRSEVGPRLHRSHSRHVTEYLYFKVPKRYALVNLTDFIEKIVARSGVQDGLCFVSTMHITAGIYINDAESGLLEDLSEWLERLAPFGRDYQHHQTGEDNGDAHLKSYLTNPSLTLPVTEGRLDLGTWQQLFYAEFDGNREKRILVKVTGLAVTDVR